MKFIPQKDESVLKFQSKFENILNSRVARIFIKLHQKLCTAYLIVKNKKMFIENYLIISDLKKCRKKSQKISRKINIFIFLLIISQNKFLNIILNKLIMLHLWGNVATKNENRVARFFNVLCYFDFYYFLYSYDLYD